MNNQKPNFNEEKKRLSELLSQNRLVEASTLCSELLNLQQQDVDLRIMQGYIHIQLGQVEAARKHLNQANSQQDYNPAVYYYLGLLDEREGNLSAAADNYCKSIELFPDDPAGRAFQQLSSLAERQGKLDEMNCYRGYCLSARNKLDEAMPYFQKALDINPQYAEAYIGIGNNLKRQKRFRDAIAAFKKAITCDPSSLKAHRELGVALAGDKKYESAIQCFDHALSMAPNDAESHYWRGIALLMIGKLAEGWDEYEWRLRWNRIAILMGSRRDFKLPMWQEEKIADKTILVYGEQGVGDEIMFASCYKDISSIAGSLVIECDNRLSPLMRRSFPEATVVGRFINGDTDWLTRLPPVDYCVSSGSLPRIFRRTVEDFPCRSCYLMPDADRVQRWRERYEILGPGMAVGISWAGGKTPKERLDRSIELDQWAKILAVPKVHFINLQYGDHADDLGRIEKSFGVIIHDWQDSNPLADLDDFAAKIAALDLVISIDNSTVHVAGGLGKQTWCLLSYTPEWRWMQDRHDSLWYPTMELFRQQKRGSWKDVFDRVAFQLRGSVEEFQINR